MTTSAVRVTYDGAIVIAVVAVFDVGGSWKHNGSAQVKSRL